MMTTREVRQTVLAKDHDRAREQVVAGKRSPTSHMQMRDIRKALPIMPIVILLEAGLDIRVDHRSHLDRGLELSPTEHMGVHASQMERRGLDVSRARLEDKAAKKNADLIRRKPEEVLRILTDGKSVFDRHDIARTIHRYINDNDGFQRAFAAVMARPARRANACAKQQTGKILDARDDQCRACDGGKQPAHGRAKTAMASAQTRFDQALRRQDAMLRWFGSHG